MTFIEMLRNRWQKTNSMACVGLDSDIEKIPRDEIILHAQKFLGHAIRVTQAHFRTRSLQFVFNRAIINATQDFVCVYKPNIAFYEGEDYGLDQLKETINYIRATNPDIPVILDAKRTDIGNTNKGYIKMLEKFGADAITVNPYFGGEALQPFLNRKDKGVIVLCRTSNPGAKEFQDLLISEDLLPKEARNFFKSQWIGRGAVYLYEYVAWRAAYEWNANGNVLLVVGATYPEGLKRVRKIVGDMPILVPGIGAQAGDLEGTVKAGMDSNGFGMIINSSRGIIFASKGEDFAEVAGREAKKLRDQINEVKASIVVRK